jgi:hypothetical protein
MSAPQQPSTRDQKPAEASAPPSQLDAVAGPDGDSSDQDIDTAGTEADDQPKPADKAKGGRQWPDATPAATTTTNRSSS